MANIPLKIVGIRVKCQCIKVGKGENAEKQIKVLEKLKPDPLTPEEKITNPGNSVPMDKVKQVSDKNAVKMKIQLANQPVNAIFEMTLLYIVQDEKKEG